MHSVTTLLLPAAGAVGVYTLYRVLSAYLHRSPLTDLPGPATKGWLFGYFFDLTQDHDHALQEKWKQEYGHVFTYKGLFGVSHYLLQFAMLGADALADIHAVHR
jgi:hypothetical protein